MSAVRMCDRCGAIFAEGAEGASIGHVSRNLRNDRTGRMESVTVTQDVCPPCSGSVEPLTPRLALVGGKATKPTDAHVVDDDDDDDYDEDADEQRSF